MTTCALVMMGAAADENTGLHRARCAAPPRLASSPPGWVDWAGLLTVKVKDFL